MLWYKSAREMLGLTLVGIAAITVACGLIVLNETPMRAHADEPMTYAAYIWKSVYNSIGRDIFVILSIILGSGGLPQERSHGTAGFTLALPVTRRSIVFTRAMTGYLAVLAMAAVPIGVVPLASAFVGEQYPIAQNVGFFILWSGCGAVFYAFTFLLAHIFEGAQTPVLVAVPSFLLYGGLLSTSWLSRLRMLNIFEILTGGGMPFFDAKQHLLAGTLPWSALAFMLLCGLGMVELAARRIQPLDF